MSQEVICVIKDDKSDIFASVKEVGTDAVYLSQQEAIELIKRDPQALYINIDGERVLLTVGKSFFGSEYLKTEKDETTENKLLDLPYCRFRKQFSADSSSRDATYFE